MKTSSNRSKRLSARTVLIIVVPLMLVLLLLNTGLLQRQLPAVSIGARSYTVAQFHYYLYNAYYDFVNEHAEELDQLGLDVTRSLDKQAYDADRTWQDYFRDAALERMREDAILLAAADQAGFTAREQVDAARESREAELTRYCMDNGIQSLDRYCESYYEAGMTPELYFACYADQTRAALYREVVLEELAPADPEAAALGETLGDSPIPTADLTAALFVPAADRVTGRAEARQWQNAQTLGQAFLDRWSQSGGTRAAFSQLAADYSQWTDGPECGTLEHAGAAELDPAVAGWALARERQPGDTALLRGEAGWWAVYYAGAGEDGRISQARRQLLEQRYADWQAGQGDFPVSTHAVGMTLAL